MRFLPLLLLLACDGAPADDDDADPIDDTDDPVAEDTWTDFAQEFFSTTCAGCHSDPGRDFRVYEDVVAHSESILCVLSLAAPPAGCNVSHISIAADAQTLERVVEWIEGGMVE